MKKLYIIFYFWCTWTVVAQAQTKRLVGVVIDSLSKQPLPYASVQLSNAAGQQATTTDMNGGYAFKKLSAGQYDIALTYIGYTNKKTTITISEADAETTAPKIALSLSNINLKEVKVKAMKPFLVQEADKTIVNVAESVLANAGSIAEVLKYAPSVQISEDGISIRNKPAIILIDGRPANVNGESLEGILNGLPSQSIEKIELISNPSAKYDATGKAVINIRTLKMKNLGTNGNWVAGVGTGVLPRYNGGLLLNYKAEKFAVVANYNYQFTQQYMRLLSQRAVKNVLATALEDQEYESRKRDIHFAKLGFDYFVSPQTTIGFLVQADVNGRNKTTDATTKISNGGRLDSVITIYAKGQAIYQNFNSNAFFRHAFKQKGREMTIDADYGYYNTDYAETTSNVFRNAAQTANYRPNLTVNFPWLQPIRIRSLRGNYIQPYKKGTVDAGFQLRHTEVETDYKYQQQIDNKLTTDPKKSFVYRYTESVNAAYINYAAKQKKIDYQMGLRLEDSYAEGINTTTNLPNKQQYLQLFPSFSFQFTPSDTNQFLISYARKIARPSYSNFNDQIVYWNPYRIDIGNPTLRPALSHSVELNYTYKQTWGLAASYLVVYNYHIGVPILRNNILVFQTQNMPQYEQMSIELNYNKSITKFWRTMTGIAEYHFRNQLGNTEGLSFRSGNSIYTYTNNFFTLKNDWRIDVMASYVGPQVLGMYTLSPFISSSLAIQKPFFDKKGNLRISLSDVFNTLVVEQAFNTSFQDGFRNRKSETRFLQMAFTYKFGNTNVRVKDRKNGIDTESNRINSSQ
jgi:iron complex outermembrane recepter protein